MTTWSSIITSSTSSSFYMSPELCAALLNYQEVIKLNRGKFDNLLGLKENLENQFITKDFQLVDLEAQLKQIQVAIDLKQSIGSDASVELAQATSLKSQIATNKSEIASIITKLNDTDVQIANLKSTLSIENNLTKEQIVELDDYIYEEEWEDQNYTSDEELYRDAQKVFDDLKKPKEIITTNIINIFKVLEGKQDWKKVSIGDKFYIDYERFGIDVETQLIELEIDHDGQDINVTIANTKDIERNEDKLAKLLYGSISTANTVNMGKYKWEQINNVQNSVSDILQGKWNPATNGINAGNETVIIDERGITSIDKNDPSKFIKITHGAMGFTNTSGNDYKLFLDATGVYAENLVGKIVMTENLQIQNAKGNVTFDGNGIAVVSTDEKKRVLLDVDNGLKFQTKINGVYQDRLYYDSNEELLKFKGEIDADEMKIKGVTVLTGDRSKINGQFIDKITTNQLEAGTAKITTAMIETLEVGRNVQMGVGTFISWGNIADKPSIPTSAADIGAIPNTYIDANGVWTGYLDASRITAGTISADMISSGTMSADRISGGILRLGENGNIYADNAGGYGRLIFSSGGYYFEPGGTIDFGNNPVTNLNVTVSFG